MPSKKQKLIQRARETTRQPKARQDISAPEKRGFRIVAVSLYTPEANWIEEITKSLKKAGSPKANRSLVVREAILRLQEDFDSKPPDEILRDFNDRQAKRATRL